MFMWIVWIGLCYSEIDKLFQQRKNFEINSSLKHSNFTCLFHMGEGPIYRLEGAGYIIGLQSFDCKTTHIIYNIDL